MDRTSKVSMSTPTATSIPIWMSMTSGSVASTANVAASTTPAEVITPPVTARPRFVPSTVPCRAASSRTRVIKKML